MLSLFRLGFVSWVVSVTFATVALAQATNYTKLEAAVGKPLQLGYYASAHKNCTPAALPSIRVIDAPKSGTLTVRRAELTTDKVQGCPAIKISTQVALYQARAGAPRKDHLSYEVTTENGEVSAYDFCIDIAETVPPSPPGNKDHNI